MLIVINICTKLGLTIPYVINKKINKYTNIKIKKKMKNLRINYFLIGLKREFL